MAKNHKDTLTELVRVLEKNGLTYKQFQVNETLGLMKYKNGKLLVKGKDY